MMSFHCLLDNVRAGEKLPYVSQWETAVTCLSFALCFWSNSAKYTVRTKEKAQKKLDQVFVLFELLIRLELMARNHFGFLPDQNSVWRGMKKYHGNFVRAMTTVLCAKFQLGDAEELLRGHLKSVGLIE